MAKEPEVINLLNKLYPFAIDDITTLPYVQVRLITEYLTKLKPSLQERWQSVLDSPSCDRGKPLVLLSTDHLTIAACSAD